MSAEIERDRVLEDYLRRLRRSMRGATADVIDECEREIRAHIDDAVAARGGSGMATLVDALDRLGPPEEYGRDVALYMMVEAGYRRWSVPHMVRSTAFWALTTAVGAMVVLLFGLLFALAMTMLATGAAAMLGVSAADRLLPRPLPAVPPPALGIGGLLLAAAVTAMVRWFVGQYVRRARPRGLGGTATPDERWVERASRRILVVAAIGLVLGLTAGVGGGVLDAQVLTTTPTAPDFTSSPLAALSGLGLALLLLAPVLGVFWTVVADRHDDG